jgi:GIY-YIG catalytic domain
MVHWVYVLESSDTGSVYVGETTRLYRRWHEHSTGCGGVTTSRENYDTLIGLYNVPHNIAFINFHNNSDNIFDNLIGRTIRTWDYEVDRFDALHFENLITERYAYEYKDLMDVRGGKYCRERCSITDTIIDRPLCNCGHPCEINMKNDRTKLYFTCPVPNWVNYGYIIPKKCNFWEEYKPYSELKVKNDIENRINYARERQREGLAAFLEATNDEFITK